MVGIFSMGKVWFYALMHSMVDGRYPIALNGGKLEKDFGGRVMEHTMTC